MLAIVCNSALGCSELILQLLVFGLSSGAVLALNAIGVTVVYGTVRILNLAHGDVFALASALVTTTITALGVQQDWSLLLLLGVLGLILAGTLLLAAGLMVVIERSAFQPFRGRSQLAPLMATLGISFILYQIALIWRTELPSWVPQDHRSVPGLPEVPIDRIPTLLPTFDVIRAIGLPLNVTLHFSDLLVLLIACGCALGVAFFLQHTRLGRSIRACAQNPQLAQLCGVNLDQTIRWTFAFGGILAGMAAFVFALYYERPVAYHGAESGLLAFTAAILGGIGSPIGALLSGLLIGIGGAISDYFLTAQWTSVLLQLLLIGVLVLRPTGITADEASDDLSTSHQDAATARDLGRDRRLQNGLLLGFILLGMIYPVVDARLGWHGQILSIETNLFILLALGLSLLLGRAGLLDLGYIVSFGIGAYTAALLLPQSIDFIGILLLSAALAGLFGLVKGRLALRLQRDYLAVVTLALGLMAPQILINLNTWTGGTGGIAALPPPRILSHSLALPTEKYYLVFGVLVAAIIASMRLIRSRIGRAWLASNDDEVAAASCGVDVVSHRALAFVLSSIAAGIAGALYAGSFSYVAPDLIDFQTLAMIIAMVILGGAGDVLGAIAGTILLIGFGQLFIPWLGEGLARILPGNLHIGSSPDLRGLSYLSFGVAIYLTIFFRAGKRA
jgi:branched-chain amino acid transport system permease protein